MGAAPTNPSPIATWLPHAAHAHPSYLAAHHAWAFPAFPTSRPISLHSIIFLLRSSSTAAYQHHTPNPHAR